LVTILTNNYLLLKLLVFRNCLSVNHVKKYKSYFWKKKKIVGHKIMYAYIDINYKMVIEEEAYVCYTSCFCT